MRFPGKTEGNSREHRVISQIASAKTTRVGRTHAPVELLRWICFLKTHTKNKVLNLSSPLVSSLRSKSPMLASYGTLIFQEV